MRKKSLKRNQMKKCLQELKHLVTASRSRQDGGTLDTLQKLVKNLKGKLSVKCIKKLYSL